MTFGLIKTHPCDIASRGAGPSYGKPRPINTCQKYNNLTKNKSGTILFSPSAERKLIQGLLGKHLKCVINMKDSP